MRNILLWLGWGILCTDLLLAEEKITLGEYTLGPKICKLLSQLPGHPHYAPPGSWRRAAVTCYSQDELRCDSFTRKGQSSTGVRLALGVVAVDPEIIPYGSLLTIEGIPGIFLAADCGSAVKSRLAARLSARTAQERSAIVVDIFFPTERAAHAFDSKLERFVKVTWFEPRYSGQ